MEQKIKSESAIQQRIVEFYRNSFCLTHHSPRHAIFSVPNEGKDGKEQSKKKAIGLMKGVSDLIIMKPGEVILIECKDDTGKQSDAQVSFEKTVLAMGYRYFVVRSLEEFKQLPIF